MHGDLWVGLLQHAVAAVFWWCPPVHRLNRRLSEVREEICDDYVVVAQGDGFRLAEVLVEMAAGLRGKRERLAIGALGAIDEKPALEGRVERLVDLTRKTVPMMRMNRIAIVAAGAFGAVALAIVVATTIHAADESAVAPSPAESQPLPAAAPAAGLDADERRPLDAALAWIAKRQEDDGGWRLDGPKATRAGATSLAILPFLARGYDHKTPGPYREPIARGIEFLVTLVGKDGSAVKAWADWRASVADHLLHGQVKEGDDAGSWQAHERLDRAWFSYGPLVSTSLAALTLAEPLDRTMPRAK